MENFLLNRDVNFVEKNMVIEYGDKKIKFCNNILQVIQKYVQSERKSCEAGGILIGRENCGNSNLPKYLSNFSYFTGFSAHSLVK